MGVPATRRRLTTADRERFLASLGDGSTVRDACRLIEKSHVTLYELRKTDEAFAEAWEQAWEQGTQALEQEAHRRAVDGYDEVTYGADGEVLRRVHRYSDALLQKLLTGRRPDVYGNQVAITGGGKPVVFVLDSLLARARGDEIEGEAIEVAELEAGEGTP